MRQEILDGYGACPAVFLADPAPDTSCLAYIHKRFSFFIGIALDKCPLLIRDQLDQMLRTGGNTFPTRLTRLSVHDSDPVRYMDRVKWTCLHRGTVSETSVRAAI